MGFNKIVNGKFPFNDCELWRCAIDQVQAAPMPVVAPTLVVPAAPVGEGGGVSTGSPPRTSL